MGMSLPVSHRFQKQIDYKLRYFTIQNSEAGIGGIYLDAFSGKTGNYAKVEQCRTVILKLNRKSNYLHKRAVFVEN